MKFYINKIILWLKSGNKRVLDFEPNKVNVITGESNTGKTAVLDIIRYCLMNDNVKISEAIINQNVLWYGLNFVINDHVYTIARFQLDGQAVSKKYYFSSNGEIPDSVAESISEENLKKIIESEFSISAHTVFAYGSRNIQTGSRISMQYFMMFNSITSNVIENDRNVYFDDFAIDRYKEALPRIFDLALGIEKIENVLNREKKNDLERQISRLEKQIENISKKNDEIDEDKAQYIRSAKALGLIASDDDYAQSIEALRKIIFESSYGKESEAKLNPKIKLEEKRNSLNAQLKNLIDFQKEYKRYNNSEKKIEDSLLPIEYIRKHDEEILKTSAYGILVNQLEELLKKIRQKNNTKKPIDIQVSSEIKKLQTEIDDLDRKIVLLPDEYNAFDSQREKYMYIGELKGQWNRLFDENYDDVGPLKGRLDDLNSNLSKIILEDIEENRNTARAVIENEIKSYMSTVNPALGNYNSYLPLFDYKEKTLKLMNPNTTKVEHVGSSSNHMFMHLFFYLAIHHVLHKNRSPYVPPFLVVDQPSRPYFSTDPKGRDININSDEAKLKSAFKLLDKYVKDANDAQRDFQIIVFEHVRKNFFEPFTNIHIVDEFENGVALIPASEYTDVSHG